MAECLLTIDTSTTAGSVALSRGEQLLGEVLLNIKATHTDRLLLSLAQLLEDTGVGLEDVDAFGVVVGPGSFTGLRVGVATVKGLAMATGKPVVGISSLLALAVQVPYPCYPLCALLDARKKEVYAGIYHWEAGRPVLQGGERVASPEALLDELEGDTLFVGTGAAVYRTLIVRRLGPRAHFAPWPLETPRASAVAALALAELRNGQTMSPECLVPCYIRPSEAELLQGDG
jgi:tRNA threonylcarbamoyladenosine biosynthesis protein TsaB